MHAPSPSPPLSFPAAFRIAEPHLLLPVAHSWRSRGIDEKTGNSPESL
jgi:hypothetical protein